MLSISGTAIWFQSLMEDYGNNSNNNNDKNWFGMRTSNYAIDRYNADVSQNRKIDLQRIIRLFTIRVSR